MFGFSGVGVGFPVYVWVFKFSYLYIFCQIQDGSWSATLQLKWVLNTKAKNKGKIIATLITLQSSTYIYYITPGERNSGSMIVWKRQLTFPNAAEPSVKPNWNPMDLYGQYRERQGDGGGKWGRQRGKRQYRVKVKARIQGERKGYGGTRGIQSERKLD